MKSKRASEMIDLEDTMTLNADSWIQDLLSHEEADVEQVKNQFAFKIHKLMKQQEITKSDLADDLNVSKPYVTKLLRGDANFTLKTMVKVARAFECEIHIDLVKKGSCVSTHKWQLMKEESSRNNSRKKRYSNDSYWLNMGPAQ